MPERKCINGSSAGVALPVSWGAEESFAVPIAGGVGFENEAAVPVENFRYGELDSMEDLVREALAQNRLTEFLEEYFAGREFGIAAEGAKFVLMEVVSSKHWLRAAIVLCFACGLAEDLNWTQPEVAERFGIRKQGMNQAIKKARLQLGLRKTRMMRSEEAKAKMSRRNFRHFKGFKHDE